MSGLKVVDLDKVFRNARLTPEVSYAVYRFGIAPSTWSGLNLTPLTKKF